MAIFIRMDKKQIKIKLIVFLHNLHGNVENYTQGFMRKNQSISGKPKLINLHKIKTTLMQINHIYYNL